MKTTPLILAKGIFFLMLCFTTSCQLNEFEEIEGFSYEAEFALPLVNTEVTIQDFLDRSSNDLSFLTIEDDGSFTLNYEEEAEALKGKEALEKIDLSFPLPVPEQYNTISFQELEGVQAESAQFKTGSLSFELNSDLAENLDVSITFPSIRKDGQALELTGRIEYDGNIPAQGNIPALDLTGYVMTIPNGELVVEYQATNDNNESREVAVILGAAQNWTFDNITGGWSEQSYTVETDTLDIDLYNNQVDGELFFSNPKLGITIHNSFGVPILVSLQNIGVLTHTGEILTFTSEDLDSGLLAAAPGINQQGTSIESYYLIDRTNSNIDAIFNAKPVKIWYEVNTLVAPGNTPTSGFIMESSQMDVAVNFELPIEGTAKGFAVEEIIEMKLGDTEEDPLQEAQLKLITSNEIPIDAGLQIYFLNAAGQRVDSIFNEVSEVVKSNAPAVTSFFDLSPERLEAIRSTQQIIVRSEFSTTNNGNTPVIIKNDQELSVKLGLRATIVD